MKEGIFKHPEWYEGLTKDSSFHSFQASLWSKAQGGCHKPCGLEAAFLKVVPPAKSLFCFSFIVLGGQEEPLLRLQLDQKAGIFACDDYMVASTGRKPLGRTDNRDVYTTAVEVRQKDSLHNSELFAAVWRAVAWRKDVWQHDWFVKADPDCVWLPQRLRRHISRHAVPHLEQYFATCNSPPGPTKLSGALEVFSKAAILSYNSSWRTCQEAQDWRDLREDLYMQSCMQQLGVAKVDELTMVADARCNTAASSAFAPCTSNDKVAFHPFKEVGPFMACLQQTRR